VKHVVGTVDEITPGQRKIVTLEGRSIGVFNVDGKFFAIRNTCPHQGASLCLGELYGTLESAGPGDYRLDPDQVILRCPWHGWEFDLRTGQSWFDPGRTRVRRYDVTLASPAATPHLHERIEGPFVAVTYAVTVEEAARIVVEV
jgi:3-phenylpropionate/trans-cinnamate dioxygenase ferredoxin subunit